VLFIALTIHHYGNQPIGDPTLNWVCSCCDSDRFTCSGGFTAISY
jgi:hypothetical protein